MKNVTYHVLPPRSSIETKRLHNNIQLRFKRHQINELLSKLLFTSSLKIPRLHNSRYSKRISSWKWKGETFQIFQRDTKSPLNSERICCKERNSSFQYVKNNSFLFFRPCFRFFFLFFNKKKGECRIRLRDTKTLEYPSGNFFKNWRRVVTSFGRGIPCNEKGKLQKS